MPANVRTVYTHANLDSAEGFATCNKLYNIQMSIILLMGFLAKLQSRSSICFMNKPRNITATRTSISTPSCTSATSRFTPNTKNAHVMVAVMPNLKKNMQAKIKGMPTNAPMSKTPAVTPPLTTRKEITHTTANKNAMPTGLSNRFSQIPRRRKAYSFS